MSDSIINLGLILFTQETNTLFFHIRTLRLRFDQKFKNMYGMK